MASIKLGDLPLGTYVADPTYFYRFIEYDQYDYIDKIITTDIEPLRWKIICQDKFNGEATTLIADAPVMYLRGAINTSPTDKYDFKQSKVFRYLNTTNGRFYELVSDQFRSAIIPTTIITGGVKSTDIKFFILSKTEYGGGFEYLDGENGNPIPYFDSPVKRRPDGHHVSTFCREKGYNVITRGPVMHPTYKAVYMNFNGNFIVSNNVNGAVIPVVNLRSDTLVSDYKLFNSHQLFDPDSKSFFQSVHVKVNGHWEEMIYTVIKKDGVWL